MRQSLLSGFFSGLRSGFVVGALAWLGGACTLDRAPTGSKVGELWTSAGARAGDDGNPAPGGTSGAMVGQACDCERGCAEPQCAVLADGQACLFSSQCSSQHCDRNICCERGTCCNDQTQCAEQGVLGRTCDDPASCQGSRGELACSNFVCVTFNGVPDDSACSSETEARECGAYPAVFCTGEEVQGPPSCPSACSTNADCDSDAYCSDQICVARRDDGSRCDGDGDCASAHCAGGFCCGQGDCCGTELDCPARYSSEPVCDDPMACQGSRLGAACVDFECVQMGPIPDDSACGPDTMSLSCGGGRDLTCNGAVDQAPPSCGDGCRTDDECDPSFHCSATGVCVQDIDDGEGCDRDSMCVGGRCENEHCCASGICCGVAADCPGTFTKFSCDNVPQCQGLRFDATCDPQHSCGTSQSAVDDDSGCTEASVLSCGDFRDVSCNGQVDQRPACVTFCEGTSDCDPGFVCDQQSGACLRAGNGGGPGPG